MQPSDDASERFFEQHYAQCQQYIEALRTPGLSPEQLRAITHAQRRSESRFAATMMGRKNLRYAQMYQERTTTRAASPKTSSSSATMSLAR